jgi:hypothetical protein
MAGVASPPFLANTAAIHSAKPRAEGEPTEDDAGVLTTLRAGVPGPLCSRKTHNNIIRGGSSPHENHHFGRVNSRNRRRPSKNVKAISKRFKLSASNRPQRTEEVPFLSAVPATS